MYGAPSRLRKLLRTCGIPEVFTLSLRQSTRNASDAHDSAWAFAGGSRMPGSWISGGLA